MLTIECSIIGALGEPVIVDTAEIEATLGTFINAAINPGLDISAITLPTVADTALFFSVEKQFTLSFTGIYLDASYLTSVSETLRTLYIAANAGTYED